MTAALSRALLEWPLTASLVVIFGTSGFLLLSPSEESFDTRDAAATLVTVWRLLAAVVFLVSPFVLLNITADMGGNSWKKAMAFVPPVLTETHAGHIFELFLPVGLLLLPISLMRLPQRLRTTMLFVSAGVLLLFEALLSHAIDKGTLAVTVYFLHEAGAALWVGALLALWIVAHYGRPPDIWVEHAARRVSRLAFWAVIGIAITGTYTAYNGLGFDAYHWLFSAYGRTLIAKVGVFAGVVLIGAYNRYRLMPSVEAASSRSMLLRNVAIESMLLMIVLGFAALLANTPPPHTASGRGQHSTMAM